NPVGGSGGSGAIVTSMPERWARYGVSTRSQPRTSAPQACASSAYALIPAPPMPAIQMRLPASGCEGDELIGDPLCCVGLRGGAHRVGHRLSENDVCEQLGHEHRDAPRSVTVVDDDCPAGVCEVLGISVLMAAGRVGIR